MEAVGMDAIKLYRRELAQNTMLQHLLAVEGILKLMETDEAVARRQGKFEELLDIRIQILRISSRVERLGHGD